ncbi:MAG TPA: sulfotransferase family 2 domain-containing protein [Candidatus Binatia bacterium]|nr:sulfotransferase family 2 domain-containing protein [Candidatus Binatia bacterium]
MTHPTPARPLVFLHVPKTAGMTLSRIVQRQFPRERLFEIRGDAADASIARLKALPVEERLRIDCLKGHQSFGLHEYLRPGARYITMLRHPVARIVSHYEYVRARPAHYLHAPSAGWSLERYAGSRLNGELHNAQTRLLGGVWDDRPLERADLDRAIAHLERHFDWVGLMERFDESVAQLAWTMGWTQVFYRSRNTGRRWDASRVPAEAAEVIRRENALDVELYEHARRRFDAGSPWRRGVRSVAGAGLKGVGRVATWLRG